jgi:3-dehydroquinate synthase
MDRPMKSITARADGKFYEIMIGKEIFSSACITLKMLSYDRLAVIVSAKVMQLHGEIIRQVLSEYNNYDIFEMQDSEENKNYRYVEEFLNGMLKKGYSRKSAIAAIGGGVVGDFAGFIASIYMRGLPVIQIPTTLLAMVDSSIGGKTAVNISSGKNIAGVFHQPDLVISDVSFLQTLPENEIKNGLSEVLKHGIIGEKNLFRILYENDLKSVKELNNLKDIVYFSALFKSGIVEKDAKESGLRAILNFGHTAGHAIESMLEYRGISHGEAVAIGLKIELKISRQQGLLSEEEYNTINELIRRYKLIYNNYRLNADDIIKHMKFDKKNYNGKLKFVLIKKINEPVYNQEVDNCLIKDAVDSVLNS